MMWWTTLGARMRQAWRAFLAPTTPVVPSEAVPPYRHELTPQPVRERVLQHQESRVQRVHDLEDEIRVLRQEQRGG
jgi:hypothetical protein